MSAYIVTVVTVPPELVACELYASYNLAAARALELAKNCAISNPSWININAQEEKLPDGSVRWTFLDTSKFSVTVHFKHVQTDLVKSSALDNLRNNSNFIKFGDIPKPGSPYSQSNTPVAPPAPVPMVLVPPTVQDDPNEDHLPAGFSHAGKPVTMQDLFDDPYNIKNYYDLTDNQKWAVATARVKKRPAFLIVLGHGFDAVRLDQNSALKELQSKTDLGLKIRNAEISHLEDILSEQTDESSSSSEESDY